MIPLDELVIACKGEVLSQGTQTAFDAFAHDSRATKLGELFVAIRGARGDGHDFLEDAVTQGATGLLIEQGRLDVLERAHAGWIEALRAQGVLVIAVPDTRAALRRYASHILALWRPRVVAITGSVGKTTTKEAIADVLATRAPTFRSWRNYNDLLGIPLALGRLRPEQRYAILEFGADRPGEIRELCEMTRPFVGVVTNVSAAHLQYFGDTEALQAELGALPASLPPDGYALLPTGAAATPALAQRTRAQVVYFGASDIRENGASPAPYVIQPMARTGQPYLTLAAEGGEAAPVVFPHLHGDHWAASVLAAVAVGEVMGAPRGLAFDALRSLQPPPGRMRWLAGQSQTILLDDSHNATPASVAAGLTAAHTIAAQRGAQVIAILGDMLALGDHAQAAHREAGAAVAALADYLVTRGVSAELIAEAALRAGMPSERVAVTHADHDTARAATRFSAASGKAGTAAPVLYVKGSEEMRMERVSALLMEDPASAEELLDRQTQAWRQRIIMMRPDRPTWLEIDLNAIGRNTRLVKELVGPEVETLVSLKADAYGHGALRVARTALHNGATWLGVATVSEAQPLRSAGVSAPILVFGYTAPWQARDAVQMDLRATIYTLDAAESLAQAARDLGRVARVHVKIDSGMARLGLRAEDLAGVLRFFERAQRLLGLLVEGVFTHLATADAADRSYAQMQLSRFQSVLNALDQRGMRPPLVHAANSAATLDYPGARFSLVRPGVLIYGLSPSDDVPAPPAFRPALSFKTQVAQVKEIPAGEGVSYGATYVTQRPTIVATLPVGYADGFRRAPANWGEVLVRGQRAPLIGRVCMDQCMVDVTDIPRVRQGDEVILIGRQGDESITAEDVARRLGTISYEVVAALLARVPRVS